MKRYYVPEMTKDTYYVGIKDWDRRLFDALITLPQGTSYNSYVVKGKEKTALIDTVNPGFEEEFVERINQVINLSALDYLVMNHAEPDHAGAIPHILKLSKEAMLITSERGRKMAQFYYSVPEERIKTVKDGEVIELGGKTLKFIEAPGLHWPETMFTYLEEDKILYPCDFFGAHTAFGLYDDDVDEVITLAKRYFGEIMMPLRIMGQRALEKIKDLEIKMIGPSHGPIYKNPERILEVYKKWTAGETTKKATVAYVSMWKSTEAMIYTMIETLQSEGIEVSLYNLCTSEMGDIAKDLVDSPAVVLGAPTILGGMHPLCAYAAILIKALNPPLKYGAVLSSYGWGGGCMQEALDILKAASIEVVGSLEVQGPPAENDYQKIVEIGKKLARKIKG